MELVKSWIASALGRSPPLDEDTGVDTDTDTDSSYDEDSTSSPIQSVQAEVFKLWYKRLEAQLQEESESHSTTREQLQEQIDQCISLKDEIEELHGQISGIESQLKVYKEGINDQQFLMKNSSLLPQILASHQTALETERELLRNLKNQNKDLQGSIAAIRYGQPSIHDEEYFVEKMLVFARKMNICAGKLTPGSQFVTRDLFKSFLKVLSSVSPEGHKSVQALETKKKEKRYDVFCDNRARRNLYTHFLALIIYERVLNTFVCGLNPEISKTLLEIEHIVLKQGISPFAVYSNFRERIWLGSEYAASPRKSGS
jgi:hypothetical protein